MDNKIQDTKKIVEESNVILIIQADNPDADSLASALALEQIIGDLGKEPIMYCGIDMPAYLKYLAGWDRVDKLIPTNFDASIIVDTSAYSLLEQIQKSASQSWIFSKPIIILDHHSESTEDIPGDNITINDPSKVSTGDLIYQIAKTLDWPISTFTSELIMTSILADSMGLATENTGPETYRTMAELVERGVSRPKLEEERRAYNKMPEVIMRYKGQLLERTEIIDQSVAIVVIPQDEINEYSPLYNPAPLIQQDHLQTEGVRISIVLKSYDSGRITGAIRCNNNSPIASKLAKQLGGGGHAYAAGFKVESGIINDVRAEVIQSSLALLKEY